MDNIAGAVGAVVVGWLLNEWARRRSDGYRRRERRYRRLLLSLRGLYEASRDLKKSERALEELTLTWLYCPPHVVRLENELMDKVRDLSVTSADRDKAEADLLVAIRCDLKTWWPRPWRHDHELTAADFRRYGLPKGRRSTSR